jgi:hypothetical protein
MHCYNILVILQAYVVYNWYLIDVLLDLFNSRSQKRIALVSHDTIEVKNKRRSERVILRVAVVVSVGTYDGNDTSEPTFTQVVNAHGGLLTLRMELFTGQKFVLKNLKMGIARECSVVRTEKSATSEFLVAFQFETPTPDFWPITFPPKDWQALEA